MKSYIATYPIVDHVEKKSNDFIEPFKIYNKIYILLNFACGHLNEVVNNSPVNMHNHNYWPYCEITVKQSGYCSHFIPLFNTHWMVPRKCTFITNSPLSTVLSTARIQLNLIDRNYHPFDNVRHLGMYIDNTGITNPTTSVKILTWILECCQSSGIF